MTINSTTRLTDLQALVQRAAPTSAVYTETLVRSVQQSMRVEGHPVSVEIVRAAAERVLTGKASEK